MREKKPLDVGNSAIFNLADYLDLHVEEGGDAGAPDVPVRGLPHHIAQYTLGRHSGQWRRPFVKREK